MISYKLAKQLKDAGFQQGFDDHSGGKWIDKSEEIFDHETGLGDEMYIPTLSELIEACGDKLDIILKMEDGNHKVGKFGYYPSATGKSLEEAVAKLWLELNK